MIQSNGNDLRRSKGGQFQHRVIVSPHGRQPVAPSSGTNNGRGTNLNSEHVAIASVSHVTNPLQRKRG